MPTARRFVGRMIFVGIGVEGGKRIEGAGHKHKLGGEAGWVIGASSVGSHGRLRHLGWVGVTRQRRNRNSCHLNQHLSRSPMDQQRKTPIQKVRERVAQRDWRVRVAEVVKFSILRCDVGTQDVVRMLRGSSYTRSWYVGG